MLLVRGEIPLDTYAYPLTIESETGAIIFPFGITNPSYTTAGLVNTPPASASLATQRKIAFDAFIALTRDIKRRRYFFTPPPVSYYKRPKG
jgi:hypothetical protein